MSDAWTVQVQGQNYGPYPLEYMQAFITEGRILPQSLVAYGAEADFHMAGDDLILGQFFAPKEEEQPDEAYHDIDEIDEEAEIEPARPVQAPAQKFGRLDDQTEAEPSHFIIIADMKTSSISGLEEAIYSLGPAFPVMPQIWMLPSRESVNGIRNHLVRKLGKVDTLLIIDATNDRAAWYNFGPEPEARMRRIWDSNAPQRKAG